MITEEIKRLIIETIDIKNLMLIDYDMHAKINSLVSDAVNVINNGGKLLFAGNGGSFADAQHLAAEFTSRFKFDREPLPAIALGTNSSSMSAIANDYGYENVFQREIISLGKAGDLFVPITTSGNSKNLLLAVEAAKKMGIQVMALTGKTGGKMTDICECIRVPSDQTARIQEIQIFIGHILCELIEHKIFKGDV